MRERDLAVLRTSLLRSGVAPRRVRRLLRELGDHIEDLEHEAAALGMSVADARELALERIGDQQALAACISEQTELKTWIYRHPRLARVCLPLAYALVLPAIPVMTGVNKASDKASVIARWGACLVLGALATYVMLYMMQLALTLT